MILGTEATLNKTFSVGDHEITVKVTDDQGETATDSLKVTVNQAETKELTVNAGPDMSVVEGTTITLTADVTLTEPGATITSYLWKEDNTLLGTTKSITLALPGGAHEVTVTVTEDSGATASDTVRVNVLSTSKGIDLEKYGPFIGIIKWVLVAGIGIFLLVIAREKILDFLWERRRDFQE